MRRTLMESWRARFRSPVTLITVAAAVVIVASVLALPARTAAQPGSPAPAVGSPSPKPTLPPTPVRSTPVVGPTLAPGTAVPKVSTPGTAIPPATAVPPSTATPSAAGPARPTATADAVAAAASSVNELGLREGAIIFNNPTEMVQDTEQELVAAITTSEISNDLVQSIASKGVVQTESILVGSRMVVKMSGDGFQITDLSPPEQPMASRGATEWHWRVKPTKSGDLLLYLTVDAVVKIGDANVSKQVRVLNRPIRVRVDPAVMVSNFFQTNWQWLVKDIGIPVVTAFVGWFAGKRSASGRRRR